MSSDGKYQTVIINGGLGTAGIYVSINYGNTWTAKESNRYWYSISMSSDGKYQTAVVYAGKIYISSDYGNSWVAKESDRNWNSISISSDGKYQTALAYAGKIYISSDYGNTWVAKESNRDWISISISSDGKYQTAGVYAGKIYISSDYGNTWVAKESNRAWSWISISSDGKYQTAVVGGAGYIYVSKTDELIDGNLYVDNFYATSGFFSRTLNASNLVYNTGNQTISGVKNFASRPTVNGTGVLLIGEAASLPTTIVYITGDQTISGAKNFSNQIAFLNPTSTLPFFPTISGRGSNASEAELDIDAFKLNLRAGYIKSEYIELGGEEGRLNINTVADTSTFNLGYNHNSSSTGTYNITSPSINLYGQVNGQTGTFQKLYADNLVYNTGNQNISGNKTFVENTTFGDSAQGDFLVISGNNFTVYGSGNFTSGLFVNGNAVLTGVDLSSYATLVNLASTGSTLNTKINSLSGYVTGANATFASITNLTSTGSVLNNSIISLSGLFTGFTGALDAIFASDAQLFTTGSTLDTKINSLSGNLTSNYATITNLASTGSTLDTRINNLSGYINSSASNIVYTTGDQTISGNKIFKNNIQIGDSQNAIYSDGDSNLIISGLDDSPRGMKFILANNIKETSITFDPDFHGLVFNGDSYDFINQRPAVQTFSPSRQRPVALLDEVVLNTGNQIISGVKTFTTGVNISGHVGIGINNNDKFGLYVRKSAAGVTVNPDDGSIAVFEGSGNSHITVLASNAQTAGVVLGSPADNFGSYLSWNYDNSALKLATAKTSGFIQILTNDENEAVRITRSGDVGIGTISPSEKLQVDGNILANNLVYNTGNQTISGTKTFTNGTLNISIKPQNSGLEIDNGPFILRSAAGAFGAARVEILNENGANGFTVINEGLDLADFGLQSSSNKKINFRMEGRSEYANGNNQEFQVIDVSDNPNGVYYARFGNNNIVIGENTEKIGIGTLSPVSKLHVQGDASNNSTLKVGTLEFQPYTVNNAWLGDNTYYNGGFYRREAGYAGAFYFQGPEGQFRFADTDDANTTYTPAVQLKTHLDGRFGVGSDISTSTNDFTNSNFFIESSFEGAKVGIGTIAPSEKLHVAGNLKLDGSYIYIYDSANDANNNIYYHDGEITFNNNYDGPNPSAAGFTFNSGPLGENVLYSNKQGALGSYLTIPSGKTDYIALNGDLVATGSNLNTRINNLSGYINSTSSNIVFTTGNQTINGLKTFTSGIDIYSGTSPQSLRIFNSTGTNSGEFALIGWRNNQFVIGSQQSQSGILRDVLITGNNININGSGVLNIFDNTNIVGNLTVSGNTTITGHLSASSKSFLIDHPTQIGKKLQYGSLEGPEHGVFVRGKTNDNIINLPNYWPVLVDENSISVNLTPISAANNIYVVDYNNSRIITNGNNGNYYFYTVYGERKDIPKLTVEF